MENRLKRSLIILFLLTGVLAALWALQGRRDDRPALMLHCGAGIRDAADPAARAFTQAAGVAVEPNYSGSEKLLAQVLLNRRGDVFMPGDALYVDRAEAEGLIVPGSRRDVGWFIPVILVARRVEPAVTGLSDLARPGLRVGIGDARTCAVGRTTQQLLRKNGIAPESINVVLTTGTVNDLGVQLAAGSVDAVIVWDAVARQFADHGQIVAIPPGQNVISKITAAVLTCSEEPDAAARFVDFLSSPAGRAILRQQNYTVEPPEAMETSE